jgi:glutamate transport system permease protein
VRVFNAVGSGYVNTVRNTPLTLLMVFSVLGLSSILGVQLSQDQATDAFRWAVVMLSVYHGAFACEALRSGVNTVPSGQAEAARSLGLTFGQSVREVILPQAFRGAVAPLGSTLIALIKNTTVAAVVGVSVAGVPESAGMLSTIVENEGASLGIFLIFAVGFVVLTLPIGVLLTGLSRRLAVRR